MSFRYQRVVHFRETDGAGVVYFANILSLFHEAYEASLMAVGVDLRTFFGSPSLAVPIVHSSADFLRPLGCGDRLSIQLTPRLRTRTEFEVSYLVFPATNNLGGSELATPEPDSGELSGGPEGLAEVLPEPAAPVLARGLTRHVCIDVTQRRRVDMPAYLLAWLQLWGDSGLGAGRSPDVPLD